MSARDKDPVLKPEPRILHKRFDWFDRDVARVDSHAMFVSRTHNILRGITVIMEVIQANQIDIETDSDRLISRQEIDDLTLFATESARMLHEEAGNEIVRINSAKKEGTA